MMIIPHNQTGNRDFSNKKPPLSDQAGFLQIMTD